MLSHQQIWHAIDALAARYDLSASGLARRSGLDPTTFNRSKRTGPDGRLRWPSTESIAKVLEATGASIDEFMGMVTGQRQAASPAGTSASAGDAAEAGRRKGRPAMSPSTAHSIGIPLIGLAQAGEGGFFDDGGYPVGTGFDEVTFPDPAQGRLYGLKVTGDSMLPLYREGDVVVVSPEAGVHKGDRVVVRTREGEVMAKELARRTAKAVELRSLNPEHPNRLLPLAEIDWMARIMWARQ